MISKLPYFILSLLLVSCYNDKEFYSLQFKKSTIEDVSEKLKTFHSLIEKLPPTSYYADYSGPVIVEIDSGRRGVDLGREVYLNFKKIGPWDSIKSHPAYLYNLPQFEEFSEIERKQFWDLFQFLIDNEINGAYSAREMILSPFRQHPFADRHHMFIVLEEEYERLSDSERNLLFQNDLIIDKKAGLILFVGNKSRFLRYVYGSDADVPEEWKKPTEKVFRAHAQ